MKPNNTLVKDNKTLIHHILKLSEDIFQIIKLRVPPDWLTSGITVAQLRVLLILHAEGSSQMSSIASSLGIALPTVTGIVDNLVRKELVTRGADPEDRRLVICTLSYKGQKTINRVWSLGQSQMKNLLQGLSVEQLKKADEVAEFLLANMISKSNNSA